MLKKEMTTYERMTRMFDHKEADRVPITDSPWAGTIMRWTQEGMPEGADWREFFGIDLIEQFGVDNSPRYPYQVLEETEDYIISKSSWGVTMKQFKHADSTPEFLDFTVTTAEKWKEAKARMTFSEDRFDWAHLEKNYRRFREEGRWLQLGFWFGFDVTHSWMVGTETLLVAMLEEPEWVVDMFNHYLDMCIMHYEKVLEKGYTFDAITWPDDMGYKGTQFFSLDLYRNLLKPVHKRAADWAHAHGMKVHLHSCGDIRPLIPELIEIGIDALNPLEVKAGVDPLKVKEQYGDKLVLHGGMNAVLWDDKDAIIAEIERTVPKLKENGGYIFSSDHSIPNTVTLENFRAIIDKVKECGAY